MTFAGYRPYFEKAFPGSKDPMTVDNAAKAVAAYERTLITPDSAYDLYVKGDKQAMTEQQVRGMQTFAEARAAPPAIPVPHSTVRPWRRVPASS